MGNTFNLVGLTIDELKNLVGQVIKTEFDAVKKHLQPKQPNDYLSRKEVSEMLKIDISSVHNWSKRGILKPLQIGNRIYFKLQDVENSIVQLKRSRNE
jgi:hypothetical protein